MTSPVTCIACRHWSLRESPEMARHGFGACTQVKTISTTHSGDYPRICIRFTPLPQAEVKKREEWIEKRSKKYEPH